MNRRIWAGVVAGVLAALVVLGVAGAAYRVGEGHEVVTRVVGDGQVVPVVGDYGWGGGHGGGFFFLFPLLLILLVFLLVRGRRRGYGGGYRGGWGCGPGDGRGVGEGGPAAAFEEQHRRAHDRAGPGPSEPAEA
jgi:hypothetical protein